MYEFWYIAGIAALVVFVLMPLAVAVGVFYGWLLTKVFERLFR